MAAGRGPAQGDLARCCRLHAQASGAGDVTVGPVPAEPALHMDAVCVAALHSHLALAGALPVVPHGGLVREGAAAVAGHQRLWAGDVREVAHAAEAALFVDAVRPAAEAPAGAPAAVVPEGGDRRVDVGEGARGAGDLLEGSGAAEPALGVLAVGLAPEHAHPARGVPEVVYQRLAQVGAKLAVAQVRPGRVAGAADGGVDPAAAEAALLAQAVRPAAQAPVPVLPGPGTRRVPKVAAARRDRETAAPCALRRLLLVLDRGPRERA
mmetsp:Transcript_79367/g.224469  ORF Transcript_79367/g.224469 Transcript_79367/m.224469 type:complete len:266 (+) Transcript_79367:240-1037(+)